MKLKELVKDYESLVCSVMVIFWIWCMGVDERVWLERFCMLLIGVCVVWEESVRSLRTPLPYHLATRLYCSQVGLEFH